MTKRVSSAEAGTFFIAAIGLSLVIWPVAFNLGAYETIFFEHLFQVWAASIAALLASLLIGRTAEGERYFSWGGAILLLLPTVWLASEVALYGTTDTVSHVVRVVLSFATLGLSLPYIGYVIVSAAVPETMEIHDRRLMIGLAGIGIIVVAIAWFAGTHNNYIMSCEDFKIAGAETPKNCWNEHAN